MKTFFYRLYHHTLIGNLFRFLYNRFPDYLSDRYYAKFRFWKRYGKTLNIRNPKTLNEKINWLKLYDRTPLHTLCADKYAVRDYVREKVGDQYLIPLFFRTLDPQDIIPENIDHYPCIIKTNHDSGGGIFVYDPKEVDWFSIQEKLKLRLEKNYYKKAREWQYKNIKPCIIVEKLLLDEERNIPMDYKIHCLNGNPEIIQIDIDRFSNHKRNLYDTQWNLLPFTWSMWEEDKPLWENGRPVKKPQNLGVMLELAEKLSSEFAFARIDFYEVNQRVYFGEITYHPGSGFEKIYPEEWAYTLGQRLKLPQKVKALPNAHTIQST